MTSVEPRADTERQQQMSERRFSVVLRADVMVDVEVSADDEEAARLAAYEALTDADYEVDFSVENVYEIEADR